MSRHHRRRVALIGCAAAPIVASALTVPITRGAPPQARTATTLRVADTAHLHRVRCSCNDVREEGEAKGSLPGKVSAYVNVGAPIIFRFTITLHGGSLSGEGSGKPKGNPAEPSFAGNMTVTRGTGRYRHAHGTGGFYGTINRRTYAAVMQTTGTLSY